MSRTDGLSGLLNRISWEEAVAAEFKRCRRSGRPATLLMLDVDHFKAINDRYGHPAGDEVIRSVASLLRQALRLQDMPARYGGEEFSVILPDTTAAGAEVIAERVRKLIESSVLEPAAGIHATISIGIAELEALGADYGEWISHADRALYAAKEHGRNRIELYDPTSRQAAA
jgi:diguanylate cyclase (GGDEF)-like protein